MGITTTSAAITFNLRSLSIVSAFHFRCARAESCADNAPMVGIAAYKCLTSAEGPFYATLDPSDPDTERRQPPSVRPDYDPGGLNHRNTIIVAVIGSVVTTAL